jgi:integrase
MFVTKPGLNRVWLKKANLGKAHNTMSRAEVCNLKWDHEVDYPLLKTSVFVIPSHLVKNRADRVVILNRIARDIVDSQRGNHDEYVFSYNGRQVKRIYNRKWRMARVKAGLPQVRVHDLKHTYGRRLRAADVPEEDRKDLLGHKSGRSMTTHYSAPEIAKLIAYANRVCGDDPHKTPTVVFLEKRNRRATGG